MYIRNEEGLILEQKRIWEEAKERYPVGTTVKSLAKDYKDFDHIIKDHKFYIWQDDGLYMHGKHYCPCVYKGEWLPGGVPIDSYLIF